MKGVRVKKMVKRYKSNRACSVPYCNSKGSKDVSIFLFPKDATLKEKWASVLKMGRTITPYMYVCSLHFRNDELLCQGVTATRRRLKPGSIPSQNLPHPPQYSQWLEISMKQPNAMIDEEESSNLYIQNECRACCQMFDHDAGLINIFQAWEPSWNGMSGTIAEDLAKIANIEISVQDPYSKFICQMCHQKLLEACMFITNVSQNDRIMRYNVKYQEESIWPKPIQVDKDINSTVLESSLEVDVKQEPLSEEEDADGTEDTYKDYNNLDIKVEPEEFIEQPKIQITVNGTITMDQFAQNSITNGDCKPFDQCPTETKIKEEPKSEEEEEEEDNDTPPDLPLECILCAKNFNSISGLKAHVIAQHSYQSVTRKTDDANVPKKRVKHACSTCRCTFLTSTDLMVHETAHNKYACYVCHTKCDTFESLAEHRKKCKVNNNAPRKPKMLDDVIRPQVASPQLSDKLERLSPDCSKNFQNGETKNIPRVKVKKEIQSVSELSNKYDSDMEVERLDTGFSDDEVRK